MSLSSASAPLPSWRSLLLQSHEHAAAQNEVEAWRLMVQSFFVGHLPLPPPTEVPQTPSAASAGSEIVAVLSPPVPTKKRKGKRAVIDFDAMNPQSLQHYKTFLLSAYGGCKGNPDEFVSMLGKYLRFEHTPDIEDATILLRAHEELADSRKLLRFVTKLETSEETGGFGVKSATLLKYLSAWKSGQTWVLYQLANDRTKSTDFVNDTRKRFENAVSSIAHLDKGLVRKKTKERLDGTQTVTQRVADGTWTTIQEWRQAVSDAVNTTFLPLIPLVKQGNLLTFNQRKTVLSIVIAAFYANERPSRSLPVRMMTWKDWIDAQKDGYFSSTKFKTRKKFRYQIVTISPETKKLIDLYVKYFRNGLQQDDSIFFLPNRRIDKSIGDFSQRYLNKKITPTTLRSILATDAIDGQLSSEEKQALHLGDRHSSNVAADYYYYTEAKTVAKKSDQAYLKLYGNRIDFTNAPHTLTPVSSNASDQEPAPKRQRAIRTPKPEPPQSRRSYSETDADTISSIAHKAFEAQLIPTPWELEFWRSHSQRTDLAQMERTPKQLLDKWRTIAKNISLEPPKLRLR